MKGFRAAAFAAALLMLTRIAAAVTVDGQLDAAYGTALVTQTTQTGLSGGQIIGDSNLGDLNHANGSELDQGYALMSGGVLRLFLSGNLALVLNQNQNQAIVHVLDIFLDTQPGGMDMLAVGPGHPLNGLTFDTGFEADHWFEFSGDYGQGTVTWLARHAVLPPDGDGSLTLLGLGPAGGPGTLVGGINPHGVLATINNSNTGGVTYGCDAASGAGVTTGVEWAIPLAAIGNPEGCVRMTVFIRNDGSTQTAVSNQVLAPVPPGTCPPGSADMVNFANIAGDQFATICPPSTDVPRGSVAGLDLRIDGPNPVRGNRLRLTFSLPDSRPATLQMLDCAGRIVRGRVVHTSGGGSGYADLSEGGRLAPGVYLIRLSQGSASVARKLCVVR